MLHGKITCAAIGLRHTKSQPLAPLSQTANGKWKKNIKFPVTPPPPQVISELGNVSIWVAEGKYQTRESKHNGQNQHHIWQRMSGGADVQTSVQREG